MSERGYKPRRILTGQEKKDEIEKLYCEGKLFKSLGEFKKIDLYPVRSKDTWGNWKYFSSYYCLEYTGKQGNTGYWIDLTTLIDSAHILDWIYQLFNKNWITPEDIWNLLAALNDIFEIQGNVCSFGENRDSFNPMAYLEKTRRKRDAINPEASQ